LNRRRIRKKRPDQEKLFCKGNAETGNNLIKEDDNKKIEIEDAKVYPGSFTLPAPKVKGGGRGKLGILPLDFTERNFTKSVPH